ncbi:MAG: DUF6691 family protein [Gemmatimonadota bacterium]
MTTAVIDTTDAGDVPPLMPPPAVAARPSGVAGLLVYLALGTLFGVVLTKGEVVSWFRIQEMFRFQSPHMYLTIIAAIATAAISLQLIRRFDVRAANGKRISVPPKVLGSGTRYWAGGTLFGLGWALVGACPGPLLVLLGSGVSVALVIVLSAMAGTWAYGVLRPRLPH